MQTTKIGQLSEGQKSRLVFGMICMQRPNLLLLDEPTNHLDIESIDALAEAIKAYNGGLVLVSHDFRLIDQVRQHLGDRDSASCNASSAECCTCLIPPSTADSVASMLWPMSSKATVVGWSLSVAASSIGCAVLPS